MSDHNPNNVPSIKTLTQIYAALNRNDIPAVLLHLDAQIERIEPEESPSAGIYVGHEQVGMHFSKARNTWAEGSCKPESFATKDDRVVVLVHVHVRLKDATDWIDTRIADGFIFRGDKVIQMRSFLTGEQALKWAGLEPSGFDPAK